MCRSFFGKKLIRSHVIENPWNLIGWKLSKSIFFTRTLEDNVLGSTDWFYVVLGLFESPYLRLYVWKILGGLDGWVWRYFVSKMWYIICLLWACYLYLITLFYANKERSKDTQRLSPWFAPSLVIVFGRISIQLV